MNCRHCGTKLTKTFLDLGKMPPSNSYLTNKDDPEKEYPLKVLVCDNCFLVQTEDFVEREEMFSCDYAYFSSMSQSFLDHAKEYVEKIIPELGLDVNSNVLEIASNDGYLLQYFQEKGFTPIGVEPTASTAKAARDKGIHTIESFFGERTAETLATIHGFFDLIIGNNVLAHVPDINDFCRGVSLLLHGEGTVTFEFPHLLNLIRYNQFDTVYHEHYSYLSLSAVKRIFEYNGLEVYKVEKIPTHGGSLRVYAQRHGGKHRIDDSVTLGVLEESMNSLTDIEHYERFQGVVEKVKIDFDVFRNYVLKPGTKVIGYGAAAKANTFLNFVGAGEKIIPAVADITPAKIGKFLPGSKIPIVSEDHLKSYDPDYVIIFPWNFKKEIIERLRSEDLVPKDCKFVTFIPELRIEQ
jgi:hypothetical protein